MNRYRTMIVFTLPLLISAIPGCVSYKEYSDALNVYRDEPAMNKLTRVVFIELDGSEGFPDISRRFTAKLGKTLVKKGLFRLDTLKPAAPELIDLDLTRTSPYSIAELAEIRKSLRCDAILFGKITSFRQYPGSNISIYMRLLDLKNGHLVWAIDESWDTEDRTVRSRLNDYSFDFRQDDYPNEVTDDLQLMSTSALLDFISWDIVRTMDPTYDDMPENKPIFTHRIMRRIGRHQAEHLKNRGEDL